MSAEAITNFIASMEAAGVVPIEPVAQALMSGRLIRFRCEGDKPGKRNAWAVLYFDHRPAGAFGCYRLGIRQRWKAHELQGLSAAERATMQREWAEARCRREQERDQGQRRAAELARKLWRECSPANPAQPYLVEKGISPDFIGQDGDTLLVPMYDMAGRIWNIQRIAPNGRKLFLKEGRTKGLFWIAGRVGATLCIGEGYSTMASVRKATGEAVIAAFSAENLMEIARHWRQARPDLDIVLCADDDEHLVHNPQIRRNLGRECALAAAREIGGRLAMPPRSA